jgi:hypothetical protein
MPALIYLIYIIIHISIDIYYKLYNLAFVKIWIGIIVTLLLNILCENNMSIVSWIIISIPFILMSVIAVFILFKLGLDPSTGKSNTSSTTTTTPTTTTTTTPTTTTPTTTTPTTTTPTTTTPTTTTPTTPTTTTPTTPTTPTTTTVPTPSPTTSTLTTYSTVSPPSIYATPIDVNFHGVLANNIRARQSNFS